VGLLNIQFAIKNDTIYVLGEPARVAHGAVRPKAIGLPLPATRVVLGNGSPAGVNRRSPHVSVKEAVFPFVKFPMST
jgi:carbamoyl-phosphate synthase large subunit